MKECPSCRKTYSDGVESCPKCFIPLMPKQETCRCPDCGEEIPVTVSRCFHCGGGLEYGPEEDAARVEWEAVADPEAPAPESAPSRPVPGTPRSGAQAEKSPGYVIGTWFLLLFAGMAVKGLVGILRDLFR